MSGVHSYVKLTTAASSKPNWRMENHFIEVEKVQEIPAHYYVLQACRRDTVT